jgi:hypothetical protein
VANSDRKLRCLCRIAPRTGDQVVVVAGAPRGNTLHYLGRQREAQSCFEALLTTPAPAAQREALVRGAIAHRALIRQMLARVLCCAARRIRRWPGRD